VKVTTQQHYGLQRCLRDTGLTPIPDQIVGNLLSNASKYTGTGGRIELSGAREGSDVIVRCSERRGGSARQDHRRQRGELVAKDEGRQRYSEIESDVTR